MRAVIFANGVLSDPDAVRRELQDGDLLIAADGGSAHCLTLGVAPAAVVGDLDSLTPELERRMAELDAEFVPHPRRKDQTDLELAMLWAEAAGAEELLVVAAGGRRLDQSLANLLLSVHPDLRHLPISYFDGRTWSALVEGSQAIRGQPGDRVSLIALAGGAEGVTTAGLEYRLEDGRLPYGSTLGLSNVMNAPEATVAVQQGLVLLIHERNASEED